MLILGKKGAKLDQKGPKMGGAGFFPDCKHQFSKKDRKTSFYTKIQENSMNHLEDIRKNVNLGPKRANVDNKGPKMGGARFFLDCKGQSSKKNTKN